MKEVLENFLEDEDDMLDMNLTARYTSHHTDCTIGSLIADLTILALSMKHSVYECTFSKHLGPPPAHQISHIS